mmetsp:Transcript_22433/g.32309  ORF Transcript_22433/g.32309 Transcript_22433/m.32309 type:complete len:282 (-) Transcript_22433:162-1007(-)
MDKNHDEIGLVQDSKSLLAWVKDYQLLLASGLFLLAACVAVGGTGVAIAVVVLFGAIYFGIAGYYLLITLKTPDFVMQYVEELILSPRMRSIMTKFVQKSMADEELIGIVTESALDTSNRILDQILERSVLTRFSEEILTRLVLRMVDDPQGTLRRIKSEERMLTSDTGEDNPLPALILTVLSQFTTAISCSEEVRESCITALEEILRDSRTENCLLDVAMKVATDEDLQTALSNSAFAVGRHAMTSAVKQVGTSVKRKVVGIERPRRAGPTLIVYVPRNH